VACSCAALTALYVEQRDVDEDNAEEFAVSCVCAAGLEAIARGCPALKVGGICRLPARLQGGLPRPGRAGRGAARWRCEAAGQQAASPADAARCAARAQVLSLSGAPLSPDDGAGDPSASDPSPSDPGDPGGPPSSSPRCLAAIAWRCRELSSLDLSGCHAWLSEEQLLGAAAHAAALTSLTLTGGGAFTDAVAKCLGARCGALQQLTLLQCPELTDAGAVALLGGCSALTELLMGGCPQLTDVSVAALAALRDLQKLELDLTSSPAASLDAVQRACEGLKLQAAHVSLASGTYKVVGGRAFISNAWSSLMGFLSAQGEVGMSPMMRRAVRRA
jgi:hypothetical protein